jgi:hypothetical protein
VFSQLSEDPFEGRINRPDIGGFDSAM